MPTDPNTDIFELDRRLLALMLGARTDPVVRNSEFRPKDTLVRVKSQ